LQELVYK
jgi:structural maintenance of chromosome 2